MNKVIIRADIGNYSFDASAKQVTLTGLDPIILEQVLGITNVASNQILYNPFDPTRGGAISSNIITLDFDTTLMNDSDELMIIIDYADPATPTIDIIRDSSSNLNHGHVLGEPTIITSPRAGSGNAISFDGMNADDSSSGLKATGNILLYGLSGWSVEFDIKIISTNAGAPQRIITKGEILEVFPYGNLPNFDFSFWLFAGNGLYFTGKRSDGSIVGINPSYTLSVGTLYSVCYDWDNVLGNLKIFVNGTEVYSLNIGTGALSSSNLDLPTYFARAVNSTTSYGPEPANIILDNIRISNTSRHQANYTPTYPLTTDANTQLLYLCEEFETISDNPSGTAQAEANAKLDTIISTLTNGDQVTKVENVAGSIINPSTEEKQDAMIVILNNLKTYTDGIELLLTAINSDTTTENTNLASVIAALNDIKGFTDGLEGYTDGLEGALSAINSLLTLMNGYVDGLEGLVTTLNGKDFATQSTLNAAKLVLDDIYVKLQATLAVTQSGTWTVGVSNAFNLETTQGLIKTVLDNILIKLNTSIAVTGTFWQATQPISAASLPLPALAATSTKQSDGSQKTQIVDSAGVNQGTPANPLYVSESVLDGFPASQSITTRDTGSVSATGFNGQISTIGTPTAGSFAMFTISGIESVNILTLGLWTGTLSIDASIDGGTTWHNKFSRLPGTTYAGVTSYTADCLLIANVSGCNRIRVRATSAFTGTATITISTSVNAHVFDILNPIRSLDATTNTLQTIKAASVEPLITDTATVVTQREKGQRSSATSNPIVLSTEQELILTQSKDSLSVLDDWDESDRAKVNLIAGQVGIDGGSGASTAKTPRVIIATDQPAIPVSDNNLKNKIGATATLSNVSGSASSVTLLASNTNRISAHIYNDSASILRIKYGSSASSTSFVEKLYPEESIDVTDYNGIITGIWDTAVGAARMTEITT